MKNKKSKNILISLIVVIAIALILVFTKPDGQAHKDKFRDQIIAIHLKSITDPSNKPRIEYENFYFFSLSYVNDEVVGFGILGKVFAVGDF